MADLKTCSICAQRKPLSDFHKDRNRPDGRRSSCRVCRSIMQQMRSGKSGAIYPELTHEEALKMATSLAIRAIVEDHERELIELRTSYYEAITGRRLNTWTEVA